MKRAKAQRRECTMPWRFLDAGRLSARRLSSCRRPKTCRIAVVPRRLGEGVKSESKRAFLFGPGTEGLRRTRHVRAPTNEAALALDAPRRTVARRIADKTIRVDRRFGPPFITVAELLGEAEGRSRRSGGDKSHRQVACHRHISADERRYPHDIGRYILPSSCAGQGVSISEDSRTRSTQMKRGWR